MTTNAPLRLDTSQGRERRKNVGDQRREAQEEENEPKKFKRRFFSLVSVEAFDIFCQGEELESCGDLSWEYLLEEPEDKSDCEPETRVEVTVVHDVTDVLVFQLFCGH